MPNIVDLKKLNNRQSASRGAGAIGITHNVGNANVGAIHESPLQQRADGASRPRLSVKSVPIREILGNKWFIPAGIIVAVIVIGLSFVLFKKDAQPTQAAWFSDEWHYRQQFDVFNASTTEDLIDFQVELPTSTLALRTVWTAGKLRGDFKDLRFTDSAGNILDYWFPDATTTMMSVYVKMPTMPKNATSTVMMYYGNPSATDDRDGNKVFPDFFDDFSDGTYAAGPRPWTVSSGTYSIAGTDKYLRNDSSGVIGSPSTKVNGTWEFNFWKNATANSPAVWFIDSKIGTYDEGLGYGIYSYNGFTFLNLAELTGAATIDKITTADGYIAIQTWYRLKITRTTAGLFTFYIKGGAFGANTWTTIGSATDTTTMTSAFFVNDLDSQDRIDNILWRKFSTTDPRIVATAGTSEETGGGPVGYWSFDEGYGSTANDSSSANNDGTLTNMSTTGTSTAWTVGKVGKALQFDGVNDNVSIASSFISISSGYTISGWINAENDGTTFHQIFTSDNSSVIDRVFQFRLNLGNLELVRFNSSDALIETVASAGVNLKDGKWHYVAGSFNTTAGSKLYIDGVQRGSSGNTTANNNLGGGEPILVGARRSTDKTDFFNGIIDEPKIYQYVLTASQIKTEYNRGASAKLSVSPDNLQDVYAGLIAWYKMDEATTTWDGTGDRVNDYSGNGYHGTASGNAHATTTAKYGNAGEFDGTDDYVTLPSGATLSGKTQATISAWVRADDFGVISCVYCEQTSTAGNDRIGLYVNTSGKVALTYRDSSQDPAGTATTLTGNTTLSAATWYYVTGVYDADTDRQIIYLNGSEDKKATASISGFGSSATNAIRIGDLNGSNEWDGLIDDLKVYALARTPDQIMQDYLQGPGPIASYNFEEKSGTTVNDISGFGRNGTITAGASKGFVKGKIGRAYDFDGANTKIDTGSDFIGTAGYTTQAISVSAWIYLDSFGENGVGYVYSNGRNVLYVYSNSLHFSSNSVDLPSSAANSIRVGQWYHVVATRNSAGLSNHYINGVLSGTANANGGTPKVGTFNVIIGNSNGQAFSFDGKIDDLKIYNYALTPWQIANEYNGGKPIAQWSFDEGRGTAVYNTFATSTNALAGTLTNMSTTGTSTAWVTGKFGKGLLFDGTNDTVAVTDGTGSGMDIAGAGSLSAWVKPTTVSGNKYIIDKVESTQYALLLSGDDVKGYFGNSSCSGGAVKANEWSYVTVAWDGAYIRCYLNGTQVAQTAYSTALTPQNTSLYIGSDGGAASWFKGIIDEPKIYQYALSPVQIKKDYNDGLAVILSVSEGSRSNSQNGLIGYWKMDEATTTWDGAGDRVNDYSGLGNRGTAVGTAHATTTATYGNAAEFDGNSDYITLGSGLATPNDFTIEAWVYTRDGSGAAPQGIYSRGLTSATKQGLVFALYYTGKIQITFGDGIVNNSNTNLSWSTNTWMHVVAVRKGDKLTVYKNGVGNTVSCSSRSISWAGDNPQIGVTYSTGDFFNGLIDDVKVYNVARTPDQIMQDYLQGPGPIASYNFEEKSGTTVNDISGRGNNGTITAGASKGFVKGKIGRAYDFDGANAKIDTGSDWIGATGYTTQALSISAWIYADGYGPTGYGYVISNGSTMIWLRSTTASLRFTSTPPGGAEPSSSANSILLNTWYHIVTTRTSAGITNIYINGVLSGTANQSGGTPVAGAGNVIIGNRTTSYFDGKIDDFKIYNYVLTPWQIAQEYNGGAPVGYWKMDEGENRTIYDWSGKGYNGTLSLNGSPATSTAWQVQAGCKVGKCLAFDGTDDYATIGSSLNVTAEATISAWIRPNSTSAGALVIAGDSNSGNTTQQLSLQINNTAGKISGKWGNSTIITSRKTLVADNWYYVTLTRGGTTGAWTAKIYINGSLDNTVTTATNPSSVSSWSIGRAGAYAGSYFNGKIDDLKIYAFAQGPQQIKEDYNAGFGSYFKNEWQCGDYLVDGRDNQSYNTVLIGNQCWMAQNLNIGTQVNSPASASVTAACTGNVGTTQTIDGVSCYCETADYASCQLNGVNGTIQKYCYSNTASMCTAEGGLYEWQQTMNLASSCAHSSCTPASGNQGICPAGWHVPTDVEFKTLEINQGMSQAQADTTSWRGTTEGDKLKGAGLCQGRIPCNTSGFSSLLAGYRYVSGSFDGRSSVAYFWSSSQNSATYSWARGLHVSYSTVDRNTGSKFYGFSVRCIKD